MRAVAISPPLPKGVSPPPSPSSFSYAAYVQQVQKYFYRETLLEQAQHLFFQACLVGLVVWLGSYYQTISYFVYDIGRKRVDDLKQTLFFLIAIITARSLLTKLVYRSIGKLFLGSTRSKFEAGPDGDKQWTLRVDRFAICLFKLSYFIPIVYHGYSLLKETTYLPVELGGSGHIRETFRDFPFYTSDLKLGDALITYYMCQLAYHTHSLLYQFFLTSRNDLLEMVLHHSCTIFLISFSYLSNYTKIGLVIIFLHDIGDIFSYAVKCFADSSYSKTTLVIFLGVLASWGYTRLYVFPFVVLKFLLFECWQQGMTDDDRSMVWFFNMMLMALQMLHVYWYSLFLYMAYRYAKTGSTKDVQSQIKDTKNL